jgi:hypothetical protein
MEALTGETTETTRLCLANGTQTTTEKRQHAKRRWHGCRRHRDCSDGMSLYCSP